MTNFNGQNQPNTAKNQNSQGMSAQSGLQRAIKNFPS